MKISSQRRVVIGFGLGLVFIVFITLGTYRTITQDQGFLNNVVQSGAAETNLNTLLAELETAESDQTGYVITGNSSYLQPYQNELASVNSTELAVQGAVVADANLTSQYQQLKQIVGLEVAELNNVIALRQNMGFAAAQATVNSGVGQRYLDQIDQIITNMTARVALLQSQEIVEANQGGAQRLEITFLDSLFAMGIITIAAYTVARNLRKEEQARRESELLQDILTHDMRNYNQITMLNAEALRESLKGDKQLETLTANLVRGVEGSTAFVERAQRLGKIMSEDSPRLHKVNLNDSIDRALALARAAFPSKRIEERRMTLVESTPSPEEIDVQADDLLDEVFVNIFSNAIKFTEGDDVRIEITIRSWPPKASREKGARLLASKLVEYGRAATARPRWRVSVVDHGRGVSDEQRRHIFERYTSTKETGLGMSIVHSLVVDRYGGEVAVMNNSLGRSYPQGDGRGTVFVVSLRKA